MSIFNTFLKTEFMYNYWVKRCMKIKDVREAIHYNDSLVLMVSGIFQFWVSQKYYSVQITVTMRERVQHDTYSTTMIFKLIRIW